MEDPKILWWFIKVILGFCFILSLLMTYSVVSASVPEMRYENNVTGKPEVKKNIQRQRVSRSIASEIDEAGNHTKVVSYFLILLLPLLIGAWVIKKGDY